MTDTEYKIDRFDLYVTPLSPLHLGTDEDYTPTGYVMDELGLHEFDTTGAMNALMGRDTDELNRILSGKPDDSMISSIQSFFANKSDVLKGVAVNSVQVVPGVLQQYQNRVGKVANRELGGGRVRNRLEIERTAYNPVSRQSFIPGSGLKGSIRTALLNHVNQGQSLPPGLKWDARGANRDFQKLLFKYKDMHQDPMRLVHIKDAVNERSGVPNRIYFCINRKRRYAKDAKDERNSGPTQRLECLIPGMMRGYRGSVSIQNLSDFKAQYSKKVPDLQFSIEDLVQACNGFYQPIWEEEIAGMQRMGYLDSEWATQSTRLLSDAASSMKNGCAFLIRLGRHSGAEAVTIDGVRKIKILQGPKKPRYEPQATTWWMAANQEDHLNNLLPMGWALVELAEPGQTLPETNAMQDLESQYSGDFEQWNAKVQGQRDLVMERISKKLEDQRKRDEEQAAKAREQAEREAFRSQDERRAKAD